MDVSDADGDKNDMRGVYEAKKMPRHSFFAGFTEVSVSEDSRDVPAGGLHSGE